MYGSTLLGVFVVWIFGGTIGGIAAGLIAVVILVVAHKMKEEGEEQFEGYSLFDGAITNSDRGAKAHPKPAITGELTAIFWSKQRDTEADCKFASSNFFVRLKLVNHEDVPCTIDKYWLTLTLEGNERRLVGYPSKAGKLQYRSPIDNAVTEVEVSPLTVNYDTPLRRALSREGWITFHVIYYDAPNAPFWNMDLKLVVTDSLGNDHPVVFRSVTIFPADAATKVKPPRLKCDGYGFRDAAIDHDAGVIREHHASKRLPCKAVVLVVENSVDESGKGISVKNVRAQIIWTYDSGTIGPSFSPAAWLDEECGFVDIPLGWTKFIIIGTTWSGGDWSAWYGYANHRMGKREASQLKSQTLPVAGTVTIRIIGGTDEVWYEKKFEWENSFDSRVPKLTLLS